MPRGRGRIILTSLCILFPSQLFLIFLTYSLIILFADFLYQLVFSFPSFSFIFTPSSLQSAYLCYCFNNFRYFLYFPFLTLSFLFFIRIIIYFSFLFYLFLRTIFSLSQTASSLFLLPVFQLTNPLFLFLFLLFYSLLSLPFRLISLFLLSFLSLFSSVLPFYFFPVIPLPSLFPSPSPFISLSNPL